MMYIERSVFISVTQSFELIICTSYLSLLLLFIMCLIVLVTGFSAITGSCRWNHNASNNSVVFAVVNKVYKKRISVFETII